MVYFSTVKYYQTEMFDTKTVEQKRLVDLETGEVFAENQVFKCSIPVGYILTEADTYEPNPNFDDHYDSEEPAEKLEDYGDSDI